MNVQNHAPTGFIGGRWNFTFFKKNVDRQALAEMRFRDANIPADFLNPVNCNRAGVTIARSRLDSDKAHT